MMDPAMMAQMIQQQQQQIIQQQNMIAGNSMMGSMYDQNVSNTFRIHFSSKVGSKWSNGENYAK